MIFHGFKVHELSTSSLHNQKRRSCLFVSTLSSRQVGHKMAASSTVDRSLMKQAYPGDIHGFVCRCIEAAGGTQRHAKCLATVLLEADLRGHYSHGLNRLEMYVKELESGQCDGEATPDVVKETVATAYVDGQNAIGMVVGTFCMELAIKKAKDVGIGWVTCRGSNHFGIAGYYSLMAIKEGLLGMATTNTSPLGVPTRAKETVLGTNAFTFGAPAETGDAFVLDMATTTAALGKVELQKRKEEPIPNGWGVDSDGKETNDPQKVLDGGGLLYLGGTEETGGYKGYGLGMMVEIMGGILGGGPFGPHIRKWKKDDRVADLGQTFVAINPAMFAPGFTGRMQQFMQEMRALEPAEPGKPVLVAGDPERAHEEKVIKDKGVWYHKNLIAAMNDLAKKLDVEPLKLKNPPNTA